VYAPKAETVTLQDDASAERLAADAAAVDGAAEAGAGDEGLDTAADAKGASPTEDATFGVSGKLWNGVLVMYDRATGSHWTAVDGRALEGEREGESLEHVPSTYTTWARWRDRHPDTLVLEKPEDEREQTGSRYAEYFADPDRLFLPELGEGLGGVAAKSVVFGVRTDDGQAAVTEDLLTARTVVNGLCGDVPVAWILDPATEGVTAVERRLDGEVLVLAPGGATGDATVRLRDVASGVELRVEHFPSLRIDRAFWYAWKRSHPASTVLAR
jgi:hypothetical protein